MYNFVNYIDMDSNLNRENSVTAVNINTCCVNFFWVGNSRRWTPSDISGNYNWSCSMDNQNRKGGIRTRR